MNKEKAKELEQKKQEELNTLMDAWKAQVATKPRVMFSDDGKKHNTTKCFSTDGFFLAILVQKRKCYSLGESQDMLRVQVM